MGGSIIWNPKEFVKKGEEIYRQNFQKDFEAQYRGQIVAIDVATGKAYQGGGAGSVQIQQLNQWQSRLDFSLIPAPS